MNAEQKQKNRATLATLTGPQQRSCILSLMRGEEGGHYENALARVSQVWDAMPNTYETDNQGGEALAQLHFFTGGCDWWIVEKDSDPDGEGQVQAFGLADLGMGCRELGYISIPEILECGAELDLHFHPVSIGELQGRSLA